MGQRALIVVMDHAHDDGRMEGAPATLYELDLDAPESSEVQKALHNHARRLASGEGMPAGTHDAATVRRWARRRHLPVSGRGRISAEIWKKYSAEVEAGRIGTVADAINHAAESDGENVVCMNSRQGRSPGNFRK